MMRISAALVGIALIGAVTPAPAADSTKAALNSEVQVRGDADAFRARLVNRTFEVARFGTETEPRRIRTLLLKQTSDRTLVGEELDRQAARLSIVAQPLDGGRIGPPVFRFVVAGDEGRASGPYYTVTSYGCCVIGPAYTVFSLETGKLLFRHSRNEAGERWLTLLLKGDHLAQRVAVAYMAENAADDEELGSDSARVLSVTYARPTRALQRLFLRLPPNLTREAALEWIAALSWTSDKEPGGADHMVLETKGDPNSAARGITLRLRLDGKTEIRLPLEGDRLDLKNAVVPTGFTLEQAPLP
ncbi:MAG: hypothetical protein HY246_02135 [Proteobacteria bacterium]|nr:hypothetical protein [Pseudomonadota bacterium]